MGWLADLIRRNGNFQPLRRLSEESGVSTQALRKAAQQGRIKAEKRGHFWFSTLDEIEKALREGRMRK